MIYSTVTTSINYIWSFILDQASPRSRASSAESCFRCGFQGLQPEICTNNSKEKSFNSIVSGKCWPTWSIL